MQNEKLKVIFFGTPSYIDPIISVLSENFNLIKTIRSPKEPLEDLKNSGADFFVIASFGQIIPGNILKIPKLGAINIHPSNLPLYRGPSPIQSQILGGVTDSAISFILMDDKMDHGPLLHREPYLITASDTFESLCIKMFAESAGLLPEIISGIADGTIVPQEQNHTEATYTKLIEKEDGYFDIENPPDSVELDRKIRAFHPWPGVWTKWNGKIVKLLPEHRIQIEGKSVTDLDSFLNGYRDFPIKQF